MMGVVTVQATRLRAWLQFVSAMLPWWLSWAFGLVTQGPSQGEQVALVPAIAPQTAPASPPATVVPVPPADGEPLLVLLEHTAETFAEAAGARLGRGEVLARSLYHDFFADGVLAARSAQVRAAAPALAGRLLGLCDPRLPLVSPSARPRPPAAGDTEKYVLRTDEGHELEMVAMPAPGVEGGWSLCLSSQVRVAVAVGRRRGWGC